MVECCEAEEGGCGEVHCGVVRGGGGSGVGVGEEDGEDVKSRLGGCNVVYI